MLMAWKADYAVTDKAFDALLGMMNQLFLPEISRISCRYHCSALLLGCG
jgi:hypothetical protein